MSTMQAVPPVNSDTRPLPDGWWQHYDAQQQIWYYVQLDPVPQVSFTHPAGLLEAVAAALSQAQASQSSVPPPPFPSIQRQQSPILAPAPIPPESGHEPATPNSTGLGGVEQAFQPPNPSLAASKLSDPGGDVAHKVQPQDQPLTAPSAPICFEQSFQPPNQSPAAPSGAPSSFEQSFQPQSQPPPPPTPPINTGQALNLHSQPPPPPSPPTNIGQIFQPCIQPPLAPHNVTDNILQATQRQTHPPAPSPPPRGTRIIVPPSHPGSVIQRKHTPSVAPDISAAFSALSVSPANPYSDGSSDPAAFPQSSPSANPPASPPLQNNFVVYTIPPQSPSDLGPPPAYGEGQQLSSAAGQNLASSSTNAFFGFNPASLGSLAPDSTGMPPYQLNPQIFTQQPFMPGGTYFPHATAPLFAPGQQGVGYPYPVNLPPAQQAPDTLLSPPLGARSATAPPPPLPPRINRHGASLPSTLNYSTGQPISPPPMQHFFPSEIMACPPTDPSRGYFDSQSGPLSLPSPPVSQALSQPRKGYIPYVEPPPVPTRMERANEVMQQAGGKLAQVSKAVGKSTTKVVGKVVQRTAATASNVSKRDVANVMKTVSSLLMVGLTGVPIVYNSQSSPRPTSQQQQIANQQQSAAAYQALVAELHQSPAMADPHLQGAVLQLLANSANQQASARATSQQALLKQLAALQQPNVTDQQAISQFEALLRQQAAVAQTSQPAGQQQQSAMNQQTFAQMQARLNEHKVQTAPTQSTPLPIQQQPMDAQAFAQMMAGLAEEKVPVSQATLPTQQQPMDPQAFAQMMARLNEQKGVPLQATLPVQQQQGAMDPQAFAQMMARMTEQKTAATLPAVQKQQQQNAKDLQTLAQMQQVAALRQIAAGQTALPQMYGRTAALQQAATGQTTFPQMQQDAMMDQEAFAQLQALSQMQNLQQVTDAFDVQSSGIF